MRRTPALAGIGAALITVAEVALADPFRFTGIGDRTWLWLLVLAAGLGVAVGVAVRLAMVTRALGRWLLVAGAMCAVLAALATLGICGLRLMFDDDGDRRVIAVSADGEHALVLHETSNVIDPVHGLYVQTTDGPFSRRGYLGCVNGDASGHLLAGARFTGANTVFVRAHDGAHWTLRFDPDAMRAIDMLPDSACSQGLYTG